MGGSHSIWKLKVPWCPLTHRLIAGAIRVYDENNKATDTQGVPVAPMIELLSQAF